MASIIFHAGMSKTGSTSIQDWLDGKPSAPAKPRHPVDANRTAGTDRHGRSRTVDEGERDFEISPCRATLRLGPRPRSASANSSMPTRRTRTCSSSRASPTRSSSTTPRTSRSRRCAAHRSSVTSRRSPAPIPCASRTTSALNIPGSSRHGCNGGSEMRDHPTSGCGASDRGSSICRYPTRSVRLHHTSRSRCDRSDLISSKAVTS